MAAGVDLDRDCALFPGAYNVQNSGSAEVSVTITHLICNFQYIGISTLFTQPGRGCCRSLLSALG